MGSTAFRQESSLTRQVEVERKFAAEPDALLPSFHGVAEVGATRDFQLVANYFDTPDYCLAQAGITLRRRTGGTDSGWHLKVPAAEHHRIEIHAELTDSRSPLLVPEALRAEIADVVELRPLLPVAELRTHRIERELSTQRGGAVLGILCDDTVLALRPTPDGERTHRWRELEVELVTGHETWLGDVSQALLAAPGVSHSHDASKLAKALGDLPTPPELSPSTPAHHVLVDYLAAQVGVIQARAHDIRTDTTDAVHKTRVATRRLRSALRTFRGLFDRTITDPLREELKWYAGELGGARDAEVVMARLTSALEDVSPDAIEGPVADRLTSELQRAHHRAHGAAVAALNSPRYVALQQSLIRLLTDPPLGAEALRPAREVLPAPIDQARHRTMRWYRRSKRLTGAAHWSALHEVRKKAKAMRYACEAVAPAFADASATARAWEEVTESFGDLQDSAVAQDRLRELAAIAHQHGESAFTYGVLYGREVTRSGFDLSTSEAALHQANSKPQRGWLRR